jgi:hypothetical protein
MKVRSLMLAVLTAASALSASAALAQEVLVAPMGPPPARVEAPPPPRDGFVWDPGHWRWMHGQYAWAPGHWQAVRVGYRWVPGHWAPRGPNWRWIPGHWAR